MALFPPLPEGRSFHGVSLVTGDGFELLGRVSYAPWERERARGLYRRVRDVSSLTWFQVSDRRYDRDLPARYRVVVMLVSIMIAAGAGFVTAGANGSGLGGAAVGACAGVAFRYLAMVALVALVQRGLVSALRWRTRKG